jgi:hypothetical protein
MSDLGDALRAAADYQDRPGAYDEMRALAAQADYLEYERDKFHGHLIAANAMNQTALDQRNAALAEAQAAREVSVKAVRDRNLILDAKMKLDLRIARIQAVMDEYEDWFDGSVEDSWRFQRDLRAAMEES